MGDKGFIEKNFKLMKDTMEAEKAAREAEEQQEGAAADGEEEPPGGRKKKGGESGAGVCMRTKGDAALVGSELWCISSKGTTDSFQTNILCS